ncbi:MAG: tRNA 2-selenouridine(34) synthase MnmH, partial [Rhodobacteraceae bacterium]|nr:tRNA 2-selenouridine(34) synthase MnmH [Paracoccaceae bacterium]
DQIGWRVGVIAGGYRSYRRLVAAATHDAPFPAPVFVLDGNTGTAKTALLGHLAARGVQVLDLEGLARHRGSLFGAVAGGQPGQKAFEGAIAAAARALDPARPVVVEAESSRIGTLGVPPSLWAAMIAAPRIEIAAPLAARAAFLVRAYGDICADRAALAATIDALRPWHAGEVIEGWHKLAAAGEDAALAAELMARHYDPRYRRHRDRMPAAAEVLALPDLSPATLEAAAARIAARLGEA